MSVKIKIDARGIYAKIDQKFTSGREMLSQIILSDCNKYCKEDTGMLIMSSLIHSDLARGRLVWNTPYAARQYYAIPTAYKEVNPGASWRWVEVAQKAHKKEWARQAENIMKYYGKV